MVNMYGSRNEIEEETLILEGEQATEEIDSGQEPNLLVELPVTSTKITLALMNGRKEKKGKAKKEKEERNIQTTPTTNGEETKKKVVKKLHG